MPQQRHGRTEILVDSLLKRNMAAWKLVVQFLKKVKHRNNIPRINPSPTHLPERNKNTKTCMQMFTALLIQPKPRNNANIHQQKNGETCCGRARQWNSTQ